MAHGPLVSVIQCIPEEVTSSLIGLSPLSISFRFSSIIGSDSPCVVWNASLSKRNKNRENMTVQKTITLTSRYPFGSEMINSWNQNVKI